jgi:hypothetical protein
VQYNAVIAALQQYFSIILLSTFFFLKQFVTDPIMREITFGQQNLRKISCMQRKIS